MSLKLGVVYRVATGEITFASTNTAEGLAIDLPAMVDAGEQSLVTELIEDFVESGFYVKDDEVRAYPAKPHAGVVWDLANEAWLEDLAQLKADAWERIKARRMETEFGFLVYGGNTYEIDAVSQRRIQGAVQLAGLDNSLSLDWTLADNSSVVLSAADLIGLGVALGQHVSAVHAYARGLRQQIESATDVAALDAVEWLFS